jgi:hypothetical protein
MLTRLMRGAGAPPAPDRREPTLPSREQPPESSWIRPSAAVAAGLRHRILELESSLKEARRQVITAEFAAQVDKHQIKQLEALLARQRKTNVKESDEPTT